METLQVYVLCDKTWRAKVWETEIVIIKVMHALKSDKLRHDMPLIYN